MEKTTKTKMNNHITRMRKNIIFNIIKDDKFNTIRHLVNPQTNGLLSVLKESKIKELMKLKPVYTHHRCIKRRLTTNHSFYISTVINYFYH